MKKIIMGVAVLTSLSAFSADGDYQGTQDVINDDGEKVGQVSCSVSITQDYNIVVDFNGDEPVRERRVYARFVVEKINEHGDVITLGSDFNSLVTQKSNHNLLGSSYRFDGVSQSVSAQDVADFGGSQMFAEVSFGSVPDGVFGWNQEPESFTLNSYMSGSSYAPVYQCNNLQKVEGFL